MRINKWRRDKQENRCQYEDYICTFEFFWMISCCFRDTRTNTVLPVLHLWLCVQLRSFLPPHVVIVKHRGFSLHCVEAFTLLLIFFQRLLSALSAKLGEEEREELGQQPWACGWFTALVWFSPLPHLCVVFPRSGSALPLCLPFAPPSVLISHHLSIHTISFAL